MHERARSVDLEPQIEAECITDLSLHCSEKTAKSEVFDLGDIFYTVIHNYGNPLFLLNNSVKHWPILVIFITQYYEETWREWL